MTLTTLNNATIQAFWCLHTDAPDFLAPAARVRRFVVNRCLCQTIAILMPTDKTIMLACILFSSSSPNSRYIVVRLFSAGAGQHIGRRVARKHVRCQTCANLAPVRLPTDDAFHSLLLLGTRSATWSRLAFFFKSVGISSLQIAAPTCQDALDEARRHGGRMVDVAVLLSTPTHRTHPSPPHHRINIITTTPNARAHINYDGQHGRHLTAQHVMHPDECILRPLHAASDDGGIPRAHSSESSQKAPKAKLISRSHLHSSLARCQGLGDSLGPAPQLRPAPCNVHATSGCPPVDLFQNRCLTGQPFLGLGVLTEARGSEDRVDP